MMTRKNLLGKEANMYTSIFKMGMIGVLFMVLLIPSVCLAQGKELPGVKHTIENNSDKEIRYVEFFTHPPVGADFIEVKE
jgi:hypothetical protein